MNLMTPNADLASLVDAWRSAGRDDALATELFDGLAQLLAPLVSKYGADTLTEAFLILKTTKAAPVSWAGWLCTAVKAELERSAAAWESASSRPGVSSPLEPYDLAADAPASAAVAGNCRLYMELEMLLVEEACWPAEIAQACVDELVTYMDGCRGRASTKALRQRLTMLPTTRRSAVARALLDERGYLGLRAQGLSTAEARAEWQSQYGFSELLWLSLAPWAAWAS
ncbi:hypothetical protein [Arthrobacter sp. efr-133-TYG-118]|uniref:hypothetical protein n=1 Tax=Arthrobacter sp. efr-133-TYG-118 TaxID=3040279 RepID=UPI00254C1042|nr:hypothetical protein [Arthrobacter sp. efr-133-TYG-118]